MTHNYEQDVRALLQAIGGEENINAVTHCATRMRFVLNDPKIANIDAIERLQSVKGTFTQAGQFQVIIGNNVSSFYNEFTNITEKEGSTKEVVKQAAAKNQNKLQRIMGILAEIFAPIIPAIIAGGLILGFRNILEQVPIGFINGQTIVEYSKFWSGVNDFLWLPGEAIFHFLPVGITWSITKRMKTTEILGIILGITLVSPQLLNAYGAADALATNTIPFWDFGLFTVDKIGYQAQVIPAMLAGFSLSYLEIWFKKWVPQSISMIIVPFFSLILAIILAHTVLGPIGWTIGQWISTGVFVGLTGSFSWLFGAIFGFLYAPLVITGLHHMSNAIDLQLIADYQGTQLWPMIALSNIAQGSSVLAIIVLHWGDKKEEQISIPSAISCYLGVTEPAMFGVNLKYAYPYLAAMIGSSFAGFTSTLLGVTASSIGIGGLPGFLVIKPDSMLAFILCMGIAIIIPFVLTIFFEKRGWFKNSGLNINIPFFNN
ncbi:PTS system trehalose-specific EIIBC component [Atopobacter phocae]|uniref:PTS system trehalose-specific EIIBC component n=1 Tax=Atopobacter phocae TaxID=136492 RepID=UPI00047136DA|nr:PTS system trehalose-specific EIIBC component [Atopobacter phocae]